MTIICAWCKTTLGTAEPVGDTATTHAICPACADAEAEAGSATYCAYIGLPPAPVLAVAPECVLES